MTYTYFMCMRTDRVQVLVEPEERRRFARAADRCGESLSSWIRRAALQRLERESREDATTVSELRAFFETCEARDDGTPEPDWEQQKRVIDASRGSGASGT